MAQIKYSKSYWDTYYNGPYESTYQWGFNFLRLLEDCWLPAFKGEPPSSFADIGCGPGQTLLEVQKLVPECKVYGVECQRIPDSRMVAKDSVIFGDFLRIHSKLEPVDFLYVSCSMYTPWTEQEAMLKASVGLAKKALYFANVYLEDKRMIPSDSLRRSIYRDRQGFSTLLTTSFKLTQPLSTYDFYVIQQN